MALQYTVAKTDADLQGILALQRRNLLQDLPDDEIAAQGFVTVQHTLDDVRRMQNIAPHVVAKDGDTVVAYVLSMTSASRDAVPLLVPMFDLFDALSYRGHRVSARPYMVVGQVCVDKAYRGRGVFDACYRAYRETHEAQYEFAITEIAVRNTRSFAAHTRIGFEEIERYTAPDGVEWRIVAWPWR